MLNLITNSLVIVLCDNDCNLLNYLFRCSSVYLDVWPVVTSGSIPRITACHLGTHRTWVLIKLRVPQFMGHNQKNDFCLSYRDNILDSNAMTLLTHEIVNVYLFLNELRRYYKHSIDFVRGDTKKL